MVCFQYLKMLQRTYKEKKQKEYEQRLELREAKTKKQKNGDADSSKKDDEVEEEKEEVAPLKNVLVKILTIPAGFTREILKEKWYAAAPEEKFRVSVTFYVFYFIKVIL